MALVLIRMTEWPLDFLQDHQLRRASPGIVRDRLSIIIYKAISYVQSPQLRLQAEELR